MRFCLIGYLYSRTIVQVKVQPRKLTVVLNMEQMGIVQNSFTLK